MKYIAILLGIIVLLLILWAVIFGGLTTNQATAPTNLGTTTEKSADQSEDQTTNSDTFRTVTDTEAGASLLIPHAAITDNPTASVLTIKYFGPDNQAASEIQDGFYVSIEADSSVAETADLRTYAEDQVAAMKDRGLTVTKALESTTINGEAAYRFAHETELGTLATTLITLPAAGEGYVITYTISGNDTSSYQDMLATMLDSITFMPPTDTAAPERSSVSIALLDYQAEGTGSSGPVRGCDRVVFTEESVDPTTMPLTAALTTLFDWSDETVAGWHNFIAKTNDTLSFDRATVENGTANIYLTGKLSGLAGVCDNPRARIQIEETALQFSTVHNVQIYLNDEPTDLTPSGRGT